ncbi:MAG: 3'-5' exonuclease [Clostridia bacterium]|nr:3'-5' exonuclease [Clostridia bacterium]MDE7328172.1 3'-5' exonuclease [Clostridia bacterium]
MNYLFFDIECANCFGGKGKICSFGYVLADMNFNIVEQKDILINPDSKFHLGRADGEGIELGYPKEEFLKSPKFDYFYDRIKAILEDENVIIFGHSVINDINFLLAECVRYRKPYFTFKAYDTQVLHRHFMPDSKENGLGKICASFEIDVENLHRSDYDAYLTMSVAKKLCESRGVSMEQLLEECPNCYYSVDNGVVVNHYVTISYSKKLTEYARRVKPDRRTLKKSLVKNMTFGFSLDFEKEKFKQALFLVNSIRRQAGNYSIRSSKMHYFLAYGEECARTQNVKALEDSTVEVLDEEKILQLLNIKPEIYEQVKSWSLGRIKSYGIPKIRRKFIDAAKENCSKESEENNT